MRLRLLRKYISSQIVWFKDKDSLIKYCYIKYTIVSFRKKKKKKKKKKKTTKKKQQKTPQTNKKNKNKKKTCILAHLLLQSVEIRELSQFKVCSFYNCESGGRHFVY